MPRIDLDLSGLRTARQQVQSLAAERTALDRELAGARQALDEAKRAGAPRTRLDDLARQVDEATSRRTSAVTALRAANARVDRLADGLLQQRDPSVMVQALDGRFPIALLPVRLETRYVPVGRPTSLRIRIYPDDVQTIDHMPALTPEEQRAGRDYWTARFQHDDAEAARLGRDLANVVGRGRAAWIIRILTPANPVPAAGVEAEPAFPAGDAVDARARNTRAVMLPDRWCAIGYAAGRREVFRAWGNRIPDELLLSPDWLATDNPEALLGGERAWLVDFDQALANGMAIEVTQDALNVEALRNHSIPFELAEGVLDRLIVVGLEWTKTAEQSAADLTDLFGAHRDSTGLSFVPLGTPTNNTEAGASGYKPSEDRTPPAAPTPNAEKDALQLFTWALGIKPDDLPPDNIGQAHLAEQRTALHMMNVLWRGTFGDYLLELWNPMGEQSRFLKTPALYAARSYAVAYLRATGALPLFRVGKQPFGILPIVGKRFVTSGSLVETRIGQLLGVLRPLWEIASRSVATMTDGNVEKAKDILQTGAWSQTAFYRDKDAGRPMCRMPNPFSDAQLSSRGGLIKALLASVGITEYWLVHLYSCSDFLPDPPYSAGYLAGVPWVMADEKNPALEAPDGATLPAATNYLAAIAAASVQAPDTARPVLYANQSGPALLQALVSFSVQKEQGDAVEQFALGSAAVTEVVTLATSKMPYVEAAADTQTTFTVQTAKELANVSIPSVSGARTLGDHVASTLEVPFAARPSESFRAAEMLTSSVGHLVPQTRNLAAVKLSLDYLATRTVGELNVAFRSTLDCFSYRLDAWISARANRRLEQLRARAPEGIYVGGFAWVENLRADTRPDSEGYLLAPSLGQAATAAVLRSGYMANHETGAFDIALDSKRTQRAAGLLQGLTRDQPLAALYGYRIERGLRDALLGRFIWPFRLAFPWRPAGDVPDDEPREAIGARDVVDGVALLEAWEKPDDVKARLTTALGGLEQAGPAPADDEWTRVGAVMRDALELADSVSDLLLAEGTHQIMQGNLDRAAAAMAVADKQALPIEPQFNRTERGGTGYTQRLVVVCPDASADWAEDTRSRIEPGVNAWLATMLGDASRYRFAARVHRGVRADGTPIIDAADAVVDMTSLSLSALSAVMLATGVSTTKVSDASETGFRKRLVTAFTDIVADPSSVTGLEIQQEGASEDSLGLGHFEAVATTLKALVEKARPATRKDVARIVDAIEEAAVGDPQGEFPGVDLAEIEGRATKARDAMNDLLNTFAAVSDAVSLFQALTAAEAYLPTSNWPSSVFDVQADGLDPAERTARALVARDAVVNILETRHDEASAPPKLLDDQTVPTHAQRVQHAIDSIKVLLGKDFPVVPRCSLGAYATEFNASLADQSALTSGDPWRIHGWLTQLACVREGANRFASCLAARDALIAFGNAEDFKLVQFPHHAGQIWAALPEAWIEPDGVAFDPKQAPEELHDYLSNRPGAIYKDIHRVSPDLTIAFHAPAGLAALRSDQTFAALVCDEWPEFVPDPYQTSAVAFHYDAPGARPPQSVLLALPPTIDQAAWTFDDLMDVVHEAFDLAKLRTVRPRDLSGGLGALLPGNYLPQAYTDDLPSVQVLEMIREAMARLQAAVHDVNAHVFTLGKI